MSDWICSRKHIAALAKAAQVLLQEEPLPVANAFNLENHRSIEERYGSPVPELAPFEPAELIRAPDLATTPDALYKAARCLRYQSCEHDGWSASTSAVLLKRLIEAALAAGASESSAAYRTAPWGID